MEAFNQIASVLRTGQHYVAQPLSTGAFEHLTPRQAAARILRDGVLFGPDGESLSLAIVQLVMFGDRSGVESVRRAVQSEVAEMANLLDNVDTLFN